MLHDFINWIREDMGRFSEDGQSWSHQLHESLFMWNVIEGTHVLTIMFFAGTIWMIDLRMMGVAFRNVPLSTLNKRVLPITMISFAVMVATGVIAYVGRDPMMYYHNIWFRLKIVFILIAMANILWFHFKVQKSEMEWDVIPADDAPPSWRNSIALWTFVGASAALLLSFIVQADLTTTVLIRLVLSVVAVVALFMFVNRHTRSIPMVVKLSGAISLFSWLLVIVFGRFIAYDWFYCEKTDPGSLAYIAQECEVYLGPVEEEAIGEEVVEDGTGEETGEEATDGAATEEGAEETPPGEAPTEPAQPAPGQGG